MSERRLRILESIDDLKEQLEEARNAGLALLDAVVELVERVSRPDLPAESERDE